MVFSPPAWQGPTFLKGGWPRGASPPPFPEQATALTKLGASVGAQGMLLAQANHICRRRSKQTETVVSSKGRRDWVGRGGVGFLVWVIGFAELFAFFFKPLGIYYLDKYWVGF